MKNADMIAKMANMAEAEILEVLRQEHVEMMNWYIGLSREEKVALVGRAVEIMSGR